MALIAAVISYPALAQSPEKFERVQPARPQPAVPRIEPGKVEALVEEARQAIKKRQFDEARKKLDEEKKLAPRSPDVSAAEQELAAARANPAPLEQQPFVVEIKRKAQAREAENGFCMTTGWRQVMSPKEEAAIQDRDVAGASRTWFLLYAHASTCGFEHILAISTEDDRRCIRSAVWACHAGKNCFYAISKQCRNRDGEYINSK